MSCQLRVTDISNGPLNRQKDRPLRSVLRGTPMMKRIRTPGMGHDQSTVDVICHSAITAIGLDIGARGTVMWNQSLCRSITCGSINGSSQMKPLQQCSAPHSMIVCSIASLLECCCRSRNVALSVSAKVGLTQFRVIQPLLSLPSHNPTNLFSPLLLHHARTMDTKQKCRLTPITYAASDRET